MTQSARAVGGTYAGIVTALLLATLVDVRQAGQAGSDGSAGSSGMGDLLLLATTLAILAGLGAVATTFERRTALALYAASIAFLVAGLLTLPVLSAAIEDAEQATGLALGPWIRVGESLMAAILAWAGFWAARRDARPRPGTATGDASS